MRLPQICVCTCFLVSVALAADLKIRVLDPQSNPVSQAQVQLLAGSVVKEVQTTSAEGSAVLRNADRGDKVQVLAPGFAPASLDVYSMEATVVHLTIAPANETVVVSATRSPVPSDTTATSVESLGAAQLQAMNPVSAGDALQFLPGAIINNSGRRGSLSSLFVRGGESRYNKVLVDGVPVNETGGTFDFGVVPLAEADRLEFLRGAQSTLYGSDAMTSVVQFWTRNGSTHVPEFRFGADGGNFGTAHGYASFSGARGIADYSAFGEQFNSNGQGLNDDYSNSLQGGNVGFALSDKVALRIRARHSNNRTGVAGSWDFNSARLEPPDSDGWQRQNNLLGSVELAVSGPSGWQHRFTGFEYRHVRTNVDYFADTGRTADFQSNAVADFNRAGFDYQGDYQERTWARTTVGYQFEDENGFTGDHNFPPLIHGLYLNHAAYVQQSLTLGRLTAIAGARFVHNGGFGNTGVPRVALTLQALRGGEIFSGTNLRFTYATGFKEPRFDESFAGPPFSIPNPGLKPERNRSFEAGVQQSLLGGKYAVTATFFHNLFTDRVDYNENLTTFVGQYVNVDRSFAQGAELELNGKISSRILLNAGYTYTSTENLRAPFCTPQFFCDPLLAQGTPLLRRPKHAGTILLNYLGNKWGGNLGGSFVGRRPDSDFSGFNINHAAGYARVDLGAWYALNSRVTAYVNAENILNAHYNEVVGYPGLTANVRAGFRFRIGGE